MWFLCLLLLVLTLVILAESCNGVLLIPSIRGRTTLSYKVKESSSSEDDDDNDPDWHIHDD